MPTDLVLYENPRAARSTDKRLKDRELVVLGVALERDRVLYLVVNLIGNSFGGRPRFVDARTIEIYYGKSY